MADSSKITLRKLSNGGVDRPLTYGELDVNFLQLVSVIDQINNGNLPTPNIITPVKVVDISKYLLELQTFFDAGVQDVFNVIGDQLSVPASTDIYISPIIEITNNPIKIIVNGMSSGGIKTKVKAYNSQGTQITGSTDNDYTINGNNYSFVSYPSANPTSSDTLSELDLSFTDIGKAKAKYYSITVESAPTNPLVFTYLKVRG